MADHGHQKAVSRKIKKLKREGKTQKQAVGQALAMTRRKKSGHKSGHRGKK